MSDLSATGCGSSPFRRGCGDGDDNCICLIVVLFIIYSLCSNGSGLSLGNIFGNGDDGCCEWIIILALLFFCCGGF